MIQIEPHLFAAAAALILGTPYSVIVNYGFHWLHKHETLKGIYHVLSIGGGVGIFVLVSLMVMPLEYVLYNLLILGSLGIPSLVGAVIRDFVWENEQRRREEQLLRGMRDGRKTD